MVSCSPRQGRGDAFVADDYLESKELGQPAAARWDAGEGTGALGLNAIKSSYIRDECSDMPVRDVIKTCNNPQNPGLTRLKPTQSAVLVFSHSTAPYGSKVRLL